jgi:hypothetical protein
LNDQCRDVVRAAGLVGGLDERLTGVLQRLAFADDPFNPLVRDDGL